MPNARITTVLVLLGLTVGLFAQVDSSNPTDPIVTLTILHTNDEHGQIMPYRLTAENDRNPPLAGGAITLANAVARHRIADAQMVLVSAGDWFQGTPHGTLSKGQISVAVMNTIGYDFAVPGNHEFDFGEDIPRAMARNALFRVVAANLVGPDQKTPRPWLQRFVIREIHGVRVGFTGLLTEETASLVIPGRMGETTVLREIESAGAVVAEMRAAGAEVVVFVNHVGAERNIKIAEAVPGIDLMIGGHIHSAMLFEGAEAAAGKTLIAQAGANTRALGVVKLDVDRRTRRLVSKKARIERLMHDPTERHASVEAILERDGGEITKVMEREIGDFSPDRAVRKGGGRDGSSPLGNWMADALRDATGAEIGLMNEGGIRIELPPERLRLKHLWELMPFDNTVVVLELTGAQIRGALEASLAKATSGLEISGLVVTVDGKPGSAEFKMSIAVGLLPLDEQRIYRVATNSFLGEGQDGFPMLRGARSKKDNGLLLRDALEQAIEKKLVPATITDERWRRGPKSASRLSTKSVHQRMAA